MSAPPPRIGKYAGKSAAGAKPGSKGKPMPVKAKPGGKGKPARKG